MFKLHAAWFMQFIYPASICVLSKGWSAASCAIYLPSIFITVAEFFCFLVFPTDTNGGKHICFIMRVIATTFMCVWWLRLRLFQVGNILELVHFWRSLLLGFFGFLFWILLPTLLHYTGLQRHRLPQLTNGRAPFVWNPSLMTYNVALKMVLLGFKIFHSVFLVPFIEEIQVRNLGFRFMTLWLCGRSSELSNWLLDVSLYEFCWPSIIIISLGFGCCHTRYEFEWLAGFLYGLMVQVTHVYGMEIF